MGNRYLITGVSAGIGRELVKKLISQGNVVWGLARRENFLQSLHRELKNTSKFQYSQLDITRVGSWRRLIVQMEAKKFTPQTIIFNAALFENDYTDSGINTVSTRKIFETNYFSILEAFNEIKKVVKKHTKFVFISSTSAFKGCGSEGLGYSASKAALNNTFESLYQIYRDIYDFKIVHFGPVATGMSPFGKHFALTRSLDIATEDILKVCSSSKHIFYKPDYLFLFLRIIKLLPSSIYLFVLDLLNSIHHRYQDHEKIN